jgi:hypothetical protein
MLIVKPGLNIFPSQLSGGDGIAKASLQSSMFELRLGSSYSTRQQATK